MSLETVNAIAPLLTVLIVAATAVAALVQLKHLRAGNQITAMLAIGEELSAKAFADASELVRSKIGAAMEDPVYRDYEIALSANVPAPAVSDDYVELRRAAIRVGNAYEELGILVKRGVIDREMFLDRYCYLILGTWKRLESLVALSRAVMGHDLGWENFEFIAVLAEDWMAAHHVLGTYPHGVRRMRMTNRWPIAGASSAS